MRQERVICDGCGEDISSYHVRTVVAVSRTGGRFGSDFPPADVCNACLQKILDVLNQNQSPRLKKMRQEEE